ncbi:MAG TPA: DUF488 family protein [Burkholderiales bacterium]|nr:DUF488 family protein [Burkholderiales bacterium]
MAIRIVRLGTPRAKGEGPRLGTVRRPPRGVRKADHARRDFYDQWLPLLSPSAPLVKRAGADWAEFMRDYRREMRAAAPRQIIELLARLSHHVDFSVGCYCEDEARCHRSVLRELFAEQGARLAK